MFKNLNLIPLFLLVGCRPLGVEVRVPDPIVITHQISVKEIQTYFKAKCLQEDPYLTGTNLDDCVSLKLSEFLGLI